MSPEEILADLRDIRLPAEESVVSGTGFSWLPLLMLAGLVVAIALVRRYRAGHWRRAARSALGHARATPEATDRWTSLVALRLGLTPRLCGRTPEPPPPALYRRPVHASGADADALAQHIEQELAR